MSSLNIPAHEEKPLQWTRVISRIGVLVFGLITAAPLFFHGYVGTYTRYIADDFCTAGSLRTYGLLESQVYWYTSWSGRYSFTFMINALESLGAGAAQLLPFLLILAWVLTLSFLIRNVIRMIGLEAPISATIVIAALIELAILAGVGNRFQSIYWFTGIVTYTVPLVMLCAYLAILLTNRGERRLSIGAPGWLIISFVGMFFLGGFSETYVAVQTTLLGGLIVGTLFLGRSRSNRDYLKFLGLGLLGSVSSMIAIILAPGNSARATFLPERTGILLLLDRTFLDLKIFLSRIFYEEFIALILVLVFPAVVLILLSSPQQERRNLTTAQSFVILLGLPVMTVLLLLASILPYEYGVSSYPDERVLMIARFTLYASMGVWSIFFGALLPQHVPISSSRIKLVGYTLLFVTVILGVVLSIQELSTTFEIAPRMTQFASSWDTRHEKLNQARAEGKNNVAAASLTHMGGLAEIGRDPDEWINRCVAEWYGLDEVVAK
jgi:hypothetical protein